MNLSGHKPGELLLVLLTGVCLVANGLYAVDSSTANPPPKPVARPAAPSTHPTATHPVVKKVGTPTTASHAIPNRQASPHPGTVHSAARSATPHTSSAAAVKRAPTHTTASASTRNSSHAHNRRVRPPTYPQRLARLHLQPGRTEEIQQALIREGYLRGDANGQWDARTHDAMLRYETDHGFPATGLPEAKSLMKLGLGSHPLPAELDRGPAGITSPGGAQGDLTVTPASPPVSQATPPS